MEVLREFTPKYVTTTGSSSVFSGRGTLGNIVIGTTSPGTITLYDGPSTIIGQLKANIAEGTYTFDSVINNGLSIVLSATPGTCTVNYRK